MPKRSSEELAPFDLKAERKKRGISQVEAGKILCQTQATISRWEISGAMPQLARNYWLLYWEKSDSAAEVAEGQKKIRDLKAARKAK